MDRRGDVGFVGNSFRSISASSIAMGNLVTYSFDVINGVGVSKFDFIMLFLVPAIVTLLTKVSFKIVPTGPWLKYVEPALFGIIWGTLLSYSIISLMVGYSWYFGGNGDKLEPLFVSIAMGAAIAEVSRRTLNKFYIQSENLIDKELKHVNLWDYN
ncbi:hypothetical protein K0W35_003620 [Vibrio parahaemolyticus]|nr:hypothetical protein [Vibrio parahaemolyticus]